MVKEGTCTRATARATKPWFRRACKRLGACCDGLALPGSRHSSDRVVVDRPIPMGLVRGPGHIAMSFPPSVVRLGVATVDDGQSRFVVTGADDLGHVTEFSEHVLDVPHQHGQSGGHLREPRLQPLVAGLYTLENARRGGGCHAEELFEEPLPKGGPIF